VTGTIGWLTDSAGLCCRKAHARRSLDKKTDMTETSVEVDDALEIADKINVLCTRAERTRSAERPHFWRVSKHLVLIVNDKDLVSLAFALTR
jgi:hypothetical protein